MFAFFVYQGETGDRLRPRTNANGPPPPGLCGDKGAPFALNQPKRPSKATAKAKRPSLLPHVSCLAAPAPLRLFPRRPLLPPARCLRGLACRAWRLARGLLGLLDKPAGRQHRARATTARPLAERPEDESLCRAATPSARRGAGERRATRATETEQYYEDESNCSARLRERAACTEWWFTQGQPRAGD